MDFIHNAVNYVIFGGLHTHLIVLTVCVIVAITLIQYSFHSLFRQIAKNNDDLYDTLHHAFREIPALLGILSGKSILPRNPVHTAQTDGASGSSVPRHTDHDADTAGGLYRVRIPEVQDGKGIQISGIHIDPGIDD